MKKPTISAINYINQLAYSSGHRVCEISMPDFLKESLFRESTSLKTITSVKYIDVYSDEFGIISLKNSKNLVFKFLKDKTK